MFKSPELVLRARSVAIVGASERAKWPSNIFANLRANGYPGKIYPINPKYAEVWGTRCYPDFASLPEPADHALVIIPAAGVQATLEEATAHGLKSATVYAANIGEGSEPEIVARGKALGAAARTGLVIAGPNCMGPCRCARRRSSIPTRTSARFRRGRSRRCSSRAARCSSSCRPPPAAESPSAT